MEFNRALHLDVLRMHEFIKSSHVFLECHPFELFEGLL